MKDDIKEYLKSSQFKETGIVLALQDGNTVEEIAEYLIHSGAWEMNFFSNKNPYSNGNLKEMFITIDKHCIKIKFLYFHNNKMMLRIFIGNTNTFGVWITNRKNNLKELQKHICTEMRNSIESIRVNLIHN